MMYLRRATSHDRMKTSLKPIIFLLKAEGCESWNAGLDNVLS